MGSAMFKQVVVAVLKIIDFKFNKLHFRKNSKQNEMLTLSSLVTLPAFQSERFRIEITFFENRPKNWQNKI